MKAAQYKFGQTRLVAQNADEGRDRGHRAAHIGRGLRADEHADAATETSVCCHIWVTRQTSKVIDTPTPLLGQGC